MIKILTVSKENESIAKVEAQLSGLNKHFENIHFKSGRPGYVGSAVQSDTTVLIYDAKEVNDHVKTFVQEARRAKFTGPIIILGSAPQKMNITTYLDDEKVTFVEKPYDVKDLLGIVWKYLTLIQVKQRHHRRFDVDEEATIETYSSGFRADIVIRDLSTGGARVAGDNSGLKQGDLLRLHINFDELQKERVMSARVVWVKKASDNQEEAGLEFVSQKAVYQYLLNYALA